MPGCLVIFLLALSIQPAQMRGEEPPSDVPTSPGPEIYGAVYALGSLPKNRNLNVGGEELSSTTIKDGVGGGFMAGVYPAFTGYILGIRAESFGLGHDVTAPVSLGPSGAQSGTGTLLAWTTMVSLLAQYPGKMLKPYIGFGMGWSSSFFQDVRMMKGTITQTGTLRDTSPAFQSVAGLRTYLTDRVFMFGEYKYFAGRYHWSGSLEPSLDLRTQIIAVGAGLTF